LATKFTLPALTSGSVLFSNGSTIAQDNANLFWNDTNNRLGIGTNAPIALLETFSNTINIAGAFSCYSNTATDESLFYFRRGRGTLASPLAVNNGDVLGSLRFAAQFTNIVGSYTTSAKIEATASQNHSVTDNGTNLSFYNIANNSNSNLERMRIFSGGNVLIQNGGTFTDAGFRLDVNGTTRLNGNTSIGGGTAGARLDVRAQGALSTDIAFRVRNSADSANLVDVRGNGNVGIGATSDAGFKLDVNGTARIQDNLTIVKSFVGTFDGVSIQNTSSGSTTIFRAKDNSTGVCEFGLGGTTSAFPNDAFFYTNKTNLDFYANADRKLKIFGATGNVAIQNGGTFTDISSAQLQVNSTTKGFLPPRMTTTQKNAIASPAAGLVVYDSTLGKLCVRTASAWETITSI